MVWGERLDNEEFPEIRSYHKTIEVQANRKYKLGIDVLVENSLISNATRWEVTFQDQIIGKCIPSCENTDSSTNDCDQSCKFYNCGSQFEQDIISSTSETTLEINIKVEGHNQISCFCDTYSGTCNDGFIAFPEWDEMKPMKDVAKIMLTEIGKNVININLSKILSLFDKLLNLCVVYI